MTVPAVGPGAWETCTTLTVWCKRCDKGHRSTGWQSRPGRVCGLRTHRGHQPGGLGFVGSLTQATGVNSISSPPASAAAGHSVASVPRVLAAGQPWRCARAGSTVPSRVLLVTCPQQLGFLAFGAGKTGVSSVRLPIFYACLSWICRSAFVTSLGKTLFFHGCHFS